MKSLKKNSLKLKIFIIFATLLVITMSTLLIVLTFFLDDAYNSVKAGTIKDQSSVIAENIDNENLAALVQRVAYSEELSIVVIDPTGNVICGAHSPYSPIENLSASSLAAYYIKAAQNEGTYLQSSRSLIDSSGYKSENYSGDVPKSVTDTKAQYLVYSQIAYASGDNEYAIITAAVFTDEISNIRLASLFSALAIGVLFIILNIVIIWSLIKSVVKPIEQLTASAKLLSEGDTDVKFEATGFSEVEELSEVLNHTAGELAKLDDLRKELIANVSHDLRTPLALIKGYSEMMRDIPDERTEENLQEVIDESERLTNLVNDMLNLSKIQQKDNTPTLAEFDLVQTINDVAGRLGKMISIDGYILEYKSTLKSAIVLGDKDRLMQVVYNLLTNAINYVGSDKKIILNVRRKGENIHIDVIDHGIGIDVNDLPHIWDRYYKSDRSHKRASVGTGLGLSIVKSVMASHPGGIYGVETTNGHGSDFYIELPIIKAEPML